MGTCTLWIQGLINRYFWCSPCGACSVHSYTTFLHQVLVLDLSTRQSATRQAETCCATIGHWTLRLRSARVTSWPKPNRWACQYSQKGPTVCVQGELAVAPTHSAYHHLHRIMKHANTCLGTLWSARQSKVYGSRTNMQKECCSICILTQWHCVRVPPLFSLVLSHVRLSAYVISASIAYRSSRV